MVRKTTPLNTLKNPGTSEVFFFMCRHGHALPGDISKALDLPSAAVKAQLNRLEKAELIYLAKKEGRYRHYQIDWKRLAELAILKYKKDSILVHMATCRAMEKNDRPSLHQAIQLLEKIHQHSNFEKVIMHYFLELGSKEKNLPDNAYNALDDFERYHMHIKSHTILSKLFRLWGDFIQKHEADTLSSYKKAIKAS